VRSHHAPPLTAEPDEAWAPLPSPVCTAPVFPVTLLPGSIAAHVDAVAEATQTPPAMAALLAIGVLAAICGGRAEIEPVPGWREGLNLYLGVVMEPGSRKSAVLREMLAPVVDPVAGSEAGLTGGERDAVVRAARRVGHAATAALDTGGDPLDRAVRQREAQLAADALERLGRVRGTTVVGDISPAALRAHLATDGVTVALMTAEGDVLERLAGPRGGTGGALDVLLAGYSGDRLRVDRAGRSPLIIERPALTIGLTLQPALLARLLARRDLVGRGLLDRFLFLAPDAMVGDRRVRVDPVPDAVRAAYAKELHHLAARMPHPGRPITLCLSDAASERFADWREGLECERRPGGRLVPIVGWSMKLEGATARIAALIWLADGASGSGDDTVGEPSITAAIAIAECLIGHASLLLGGGQASSVDGDRAALVGWLRGHRSVTRRELFEAHRSRFPTVAHLLPLLDDLVADGSLRRLPRVRAPGRPSDRYLVHPALHGQPDR